MTFCDVQVLFFLTTMPFQNTDPLGSTATATTTVTTSATLVTADSEKERNSLSHSLKKLLKSFKNWARKSRFTSI